MDMSYPFPPASSAESKRDKDRESMFLLAGIVFENSTEKLNMRVRNISNGGMMVDCPVVHEKGRPLIAELKGIGAVAGRVAWSNAGKMGVAFNVEVDPKLTRQPVGVAAKTPFYSTPDTTTRRPGLGIR
jgi:PilZ domain